MDMTQYKQSESNDLKAADHIGQNMKVTIEKVTIRNFEANDKQPANSKPSLSFKDKEKTLVLNATNTKILCVAYGDDSDSWIGHEIGLSVADYTSKGFGHGWVITPLDVKAPEFDDDIPF